MIGFIFGHGDITKEEFDLHYIPYINKGISLNHTFIVCDYKGADTMAQEYLNFIQYNKVIIYHMFEKPRVQSNILWETKGGFISDDERDSKCTLESNYDIAYLKINREKSGTAKNINRRKRLDDII